MICRECIESYWIKNSQVIDMAWDVPPTRCSWAWHLQGLTAFMQSSEEAHGLWVAVRQRKCPGSARGSAAVQQCGSAALHGCLSYLIIRVIRGIIQAPPVYESKSGSIVRSLRAPPRGEFFAKKSSHVEASSEVQYLRSFLKHSAYSAFCNILDLVPICANLCQLVPGELVSVFQGWDAGRPSGQGQLWTERASSQGGAQTVQTCPLPDTDRSSRLCCIFFMFHLRWCKDQFFGWTCL